MNLSRSDAPHFDGEDAWRWTALLADGPAAGQKLWRSWNDGALYVQRNPQGEWFDPPMAMDRQVDAQRYVLARVDEDRRRCVYVWDEDRRMMGREPAFVVEPRGGRRVVPLTDSTHRERTE